MVPSLTSQGHNPPPRLETKGRWPANQLGYFHSGASTALEAKMSVASQRVLEYLEAQPGLIFNKLYQQPSTALAIFRRMLPHLGENASLVTLGRNKGLLTDLFPLSKLRILS